MLSQRVKKLCPYTPGEQPSGRAFIKLNTNENPYPPSPLAGEVLHSFDYAKLKLYPDPDAKLLKKEIALAEGVDAQNVFLGNGSDEILAFAFYALFDSRVAFADITYSFYPTYCTLYGIDYTLLPLGQDLQIKPSDYLKNFGGVVICNPNAPTGLCLTSGGIESVAANCGCNILVDEAYVDFAPSGTSAVPLVKKYSNLLVVKTFSKSYSLAGLRCGYAIGSSELIAGLENVKNSFNSYPLDALCQAAALAAFKDIDYHRLCTKKVISTRERIKTALKKAGYFITDSQSNFIFMSDGACAEELYSYLRQNGVLTRWFNTSALKNYLRVTVGSDEEMNEFLRLAIKYKNSNR